MATAKAVLGGLLSGVGKGMVEQDTDRRKIAEQMRQEALDRVRRREDQDFQLQRDEEQRNFLTTQDENRAERDRGLLSQVDTNEQGERIGITRGGETIDLGYKGGLLTKSGSGSTGSGRGDEMSGISMSAEEKRLYDEVKQRYTDPNTNRIDWDKFVQHLRSMPEERGGSRWNEIADHLTGAIGTNMTEAEASEKAAREAQSRMSVFKLRESEFPETGGDVERFTQQRTQQLVGGQRGAAQGGQSAAGAPSGSGSQADPYRASTQADVDWFLQNAPSGAVIEVDGKLYTK